MTKKYQRPGRGKTQAAKSAPSPKKRSSPGQTRSRALFPNPPPLSATRQRLVEAARAHFFSHGFRRVTMDDLAAELGVSKKTLYAHFPAKLVLLEAVLANKFAGINSQLERIVRDAAKDFSGALHRLLTTTQHELDEIKPPFIRDLRQKAPDVFQLVEQRRSEMIQRHFGKLFSEGQRAGKVRRDIPTRLMIEILLGAVRAVINPVKISELKLTPRLGFASILTILLEGALVRR